MIQRAAALALLAVACVHRNAASLPPMWDDRRLEAALSGGQAKAALAVLTFETGPLRNEGELRIGDMVTTALARTGRVALVERQHIDRALDEQRFKLTGAIDDASKAAEVGKLLGAEAVIFGAVSNATQERVDKFAYDLVRTQVRIDARAVDTTTGRIIFSESGEGISEARVVRSADGTLISGLRDTREEYRKAAAAATEALGKRIAPLFPVLGFVVSVSRDEVRADFGAESGVSVGAELVAFRTGQRLLHPVTKQPLGWEKRVLGVLVVRSVEQRGATLAPLESPAEPLRPGDVVVLSERLE